MIAYASRTGTKRNLALLRDAGWRLMISAKGVLRSEGFPYALDNGAWWAFANGQPFDVEAFLKAYDKFGLDADFTVLPDIVAGGIKSLEFSLEWKARLGPGKWMLAVQDGMLVSDVIPHIGPECGLFIGGTTEWKEQTLGVWGGIARVVGAKMHVGRVNTVRRINLCAAAGANSFDGSSASKYAVTLDLLDRARKRLP